MARPVVLVVDDDPGVRESFRLILEDHYDVVDVPDGPSALDVVRASAVDLVLLDIRLPGMDGIEVLERIKVLDERIEVLLVTAVKTVRTAVDAMKLGAFDYLTKPFEEDELLSLSRRALERRALEREVAFLRSELARAHDSDEIVGRHPTIEKLHGLIAQVARTPPTVLITGESGTGKELVARAIHHKGPRREGPFVAVNPAAIAETLIESDLFGHERGAFTGAHQRKLGKFELAQGGTLFLDEIGTLRAELQAKLLRVLQEREIERVGGTRPVKIDVRFIAATNTNLREAVSRGSWVTGGDPLPSARRRTANRVKVEVEDTGTGIEPSETDRIFNPFYTTRSGGTGLGLALAHKIVQDHGGRITFTSEPGRGTTFTIVLPLVAEPPIATEDSP